MGAGLATGVLTCSLCGETGTRAVYLESGGRHYFLESSPGVCRCQPKRGKVSGHRTGAASNPYGVAGIWLCRRRFKRWPKRTCRDGRFPM